jgi:hypothetical protein
MVDKHRPAVTRPVHPEEPYARFVLFRRSTREGADWFQTHWLGLILLAQLGLTTVFIVFATTYGFSESTIFFGALAAYNLVALLVRLLFADHNRIRQLWDDV